MATSQSSKSKKGAKNRSKRVPSVKKLEAVRTLSAICEGAHTALR